MFQVFDWVEETWEVAQPPALEDQRIIDVIC